MRVRIPTDLGAIVRLHRHLAPVLSGYDASIATKRKDFTQIAFDVVQRATGEVTAPAPSKKQESGRKDRKRQPIPKQAPKPGPRG